MTAVATITEDEAKSQAKKHLDGGVPLAARRLLEPFLRDGTSDVETYALFGRACIDSNDLTDALDLLTPMPEVGSAAGREARLRLAQVLLLQNRPLEAIEHLANLAMTSPDDRDVIETLAFGVLQQGDADRALVLFGEACQRYPLTPRLAVGMIKAFSAQGNFDAAIEFATEADRLIPNHSAILLQWAQALTQARRLDEAETKLRKLLRDAGPLKETALQLATVSLMKDAPEEARKFFRMAHRLDPKDESLRHLAMAERGDQGERASDSYVAGLFDNYAAKFEASLIGLGYRVPGLIHNLVHRRCSAEGEPPRLGDMLDLGCGTGLLGVVLHDMKTGLWRGVDLSREMIDEARAKGLYDELLVEEITAHLRQNERRWDCVFAADVFCYFGDLAEVFELMLSRLKPGGFFAFTVEALNNAGTRSWVKTATGRYAHGEAYVRALVGKGRDVEIVPEILRVDRERPVDGLLVSGFAP